MLITAHKCLKITGKFAKYQVVPARPQKLPKASLRDWKLACNVFYVTDFLPLYIILFQFTFLYRNAPFRFTTDADV